MMLCGGDAYTLLYVTICCLCNQFHYRRPRESRWMACVNCGRWLSEQLQGPEKRPLAFPIGDRDAARKSYVDGLP